ncbi:hypothetical protein [Azohydromonas australica]|uniref:hypothetical protein n=1 Tax=Azohydromonas australica TaxID=364039 RepID=UPI0003FD132A|nr:hypothetical protein [Azohydromonas australica]
MPSKKIPASKKASAKAAPAKVARAAKTTQAATAPATPAAVYRLKVDLANLAVGAKTLKQLSRAVGKLAQTLTRMEEGANVSLEQPVTAKGAHLATTDAKLARRFGMEEGRAPRGAKTAAPVAKKASGAAQAAAAPAKKAAAKKAAAKKTRTQAMAADAVPAAEAATTTAPAKKAAAKKAAAKKAPAKKAAGKKAARKTGANGADEPQRAEGGESAAVPEAPPATDLPGSEVTPS